MNNLLAEYGMLFITLGLPLVMVLSLRIPKKVAQTSKNKGLTKAQKMSIKSRVNHSGKTRQNRKSRTKHTQTQITELPPFNHPSRGSFYEMKKFKGTRIGEHDLIPLYKNGEYSAVVTKTTTRDSKKHRLKVNEKVSIGNEIIYSLKNELIESENLKYKGDVSYSEQQLMEKLKRFSKTVRTDDNKKLKVKNIDIYNDFIKKTTK